MDVGLAALPSAAARGPPVERGGGQFRPWPGGGRTGRLTKARGIPGPGTSLGEDWLAGWRLVDTHVRHWAAGVPWL